MDHLPEIGLTLIFSQLSLQELISLRSVCIRWLVIIEQICQNKRSLKLFGSSASVRDYCQEVNTFAMDDELYWTLKDVAFDDDLIIQENYFDVAFCDLLADLFPNVDQLIIYLEWDSPFNCLPYLLQKWQFLKYFSMCGTNYCSDENFIILLSDAINSLTCLKRLDLLASDLFLNRADFSLAFGICQVLPLLEHFSLYRYNEDIVSVLRQIGPNCHSLRFDLTCSLTVHALNQSIVLNPNLTTSVTHLRLSGVDEPELIRCVCSHMSFLKYLDISFSNWFQPELDFDTIALLKQLKNLTQLRLANILIQMELDLFNSPQIVSVKTLHITGVMYFLGFNGEHFCRIISTWFPSVEAISLHNFGDDHCEVSAVNQYIQCQVLANLYLFPHLLTHNLFTKEDTQKYLGRHKYCIETEDEPDAYPDEICCSARYCSHC